MIDGFLKFSTQEEAESVFGSLGLTLVPSTQYLNGNRIDIDVVFNNGIIQIQTGETTNEFGMPIAEYTTLEGFHVNVRYDGDALPAEFESYSIIPVNPVCVWA